tara:strand:- start:577 stop:1851 length:1275 start_codon:yes stop_codon:yes gene_type:complete
MIYCKRCLYSSNHPFTILFDDEGVCSGCRIHEEKDSLDWKKRSEKLGRLLQSFKNKNNNNYDCVIPVSGGSDAYFIVHLIKKVYGLNPLLVTYNKHYNSETGISNLSYLRLLLGCDIMTLNIDGELVKKINLATLEKLGSMYWHCIAGETAYPVQVAVKFKIPLIIWGLHQGCDQVGMFSHTDEVEMTRKFRKEHDLMGIEAEDLVDSHGLSERELQPYFYPHNKEIESVGVRGIYLSNYIRWDSKTQHEEMIKLYGYETIEQQRTFNPYNNSDSIHYNGLHDYIKFLKLGYGKVTDHANQEIRFGRLSREEGIGLVNQFQFKEPKDIDIFSKWQGLGKAELLSQVNNHRDRSAWHLTNEKWELKNFICRHDRTKDPKVEKARLERTEKSEFIINRTEEKPIEKISYTMLTTGYVDHKRRTLFQ